MATHSSILAWKIPQTEELGGLQSMGSKKVRPSGMDTTEEYSFILPGAEVIQKVPLIISHRDILKSNFYFYQNIYVEKILNQVIP